MNNAIRVARTVLSRKGVSSAFVSMLQMSSTIFLSALFLSLLTGLVLYKTVLITTSSTFSTFWTFYGAVVSIFLLSRIPYAFLYDDEHTDVYPTVLYPSVSVVIAAKNEEEGIFRTIETCLMSQYPGEIECIVINDGSTDNTHEELVRAKAVFNDRIQVITFEENRGKREALSVGITAAKNDVFVFVDSDSYVRQDSIQHVVEHFLNDNTVGAVSGNTKVENIDENLLTRMQSIQYSISYDIYKACESVHKSVTCCPGCFSAYRRGAIKPLIDEWKAQTFLGIKGTFGDDRSLTNFVLRSWNVVYCEKAIATTVVPNRFNIYWKQQLRWKKSWVREGILGGLFMWRRSSVLGSLGFYIHFTFPFLGPLLALNVLIYSVVTHNPFLFVMFIMGFMVIGMLFSLFVRLYRNAKNFYVMPIFSILFVTVLIWQMPYAILTIKKVHWGTR